MTQKSIDTAVGAIKRLLAGLPLDSLLLVRALVNAALRRLRG
jgi:hypothetical protein